MNAAQVIADRLDECADHVPGEDEEHNLGECALEALAEAGFAVVKLPDMRNDGYYGGVSVQGDEILICNMWTGSVRACEVAAQILRAADQLDKIQALEAQS